LSAQSYEPTQADVAVFTSLKEAPTTPHAARWYKHIATYQTEFASLPGDASKSADSYAPSTSAAVAAPAAKAAKAEEDDDDEVDLFGSDDDEVDEAAEKLKKERVAEYEKKKAGKAKPAAKVRPCLPAALL
jgi:elongation factor 1-beta